MFYRNLKKFRVAVALIFFVATFILFVDIYRIFPVELYSIVLYFQFLPSLVDFVSSPIFDFSGFIIILILTLLIGRLYCSAICPLGIFMDFITRLRFKFFKRKKYSFKKPNYFISYSILILTIFFWIIAVISFLTLLDPYSIFGRITNILFLPLVIFLNNSLTSILESLNIFTLIRIDYAIVPTLVLIISIAYFISIFIFAFFWGRQFCNLICPVGTFLGLFAKISLFKIKFDEQKCKQCGACEKVCKAYCINSEKMELEFSQCVSCFNCIDVCPESGFHYKFSFSKKGNNFSAERREVVLKTSTLVLSIGALGACTNYPTTKEAKKRNISRFPVIPPGAFSLEHFNANCTACYTCVAVCPTNVIQPTFLDFGFEGILQPKMDYWKSFCNYDCTKCTEVCPSGAIRPLGQEQKHLTQIGIAKFVKEDCVVETEKKDCGACAEHCPTKAVRMVPYGKITIPEVTDEICIGCGACEFACPTQPKKAIYVESNLIHKKAEKPKPAEQPKIQLDEFPF